MPDGDAILLDRVEERLAPRVEQLAAWLEARAEGKATRREIQRHAVAGVRTAEHATALLAQYDSVYPGSVRRERAGSRGPTSLVVYAPRRATDRDREPAPAREPADPVTVSADSLGSHGHAGGTWGSDDKAAGQSPSADRFSENGSQQETVNTADSSLSTVLC